MGRRQDEAVKTRQKLMDAIHELAKEKDYHDIRIEEITEKAGVAKGTFYVYFKRKEDLIAAAAYHGFHAIRDEALQEIGAIAQIACFLRASTAKIETGTLETAQQWLRSAVAPLEKESRGLSKLNFDIAFMEDCISEAIRHGELAANAPARELAEQVVAQYYGFLTLWCISGGALSMRDMMERFCDSRLATILTK